MSPSIVPYGSWPSPLGARLMGDASLGLSEVRVDGADVYWLEQRPAESGRGVIVRASEGHEPVDVVHRSADVRSRVNEYGGGAYAVSAGTVVYADDAQQRLHCMRAGGSPRPITPEPRVHRGERYADIEFLPGGTDVACVRESHASTGEPEHTLVRVPLDGTHRPVVLEAGRDFYASPRVSPNGRSLAWIAWDHPYMPWDRSEAWVAEIEPSGTLGDARRVAGGGEESIFQVVWSPSGKLHVVSDRSGFWNLHRVEAEGELSALAPAQAELGHPQWIFALSAVAFLGDGRIVCAHQIEGLWHIGVIEQGTTHIVPVDLPYTDHAGAPRIVADARDRILFVGGAPARAPEVVRVTLGDGSRVHAVEVLRRSMTLDVDPGMLSRPEPITFPTSGDRTAHALFYPPTHAACRAPDGERPPLRVKVHGGPTSSASSALSLETQFWTSRGVAVVDVNYSGSSGYGRAYRERLREQWGIADVNDCVAVATHLAREGRVDGSRMVMCGGSAGGYTTLCAIVFHDVFAAGVSRYGVGDLEALAADTHKFESRYLDHLVGPYPAARARYRERSPLHFADRISCPVILLQGLEDAVVPPAQAEALIEALEAKGLPYAYVTFPDEGHGFRRAGSRVRAVEAELAFLGRVLGFVPDDDLPRLDVRNAPA